MLIFEIVSSRTVEARDNGDKRYVAYMLQVRQDSATVNDPHPANVERRYTHFQQLHNKLCKDFPTVLSQITFPKKVLVGNFDPELISSRCTGFEALLKLISEDSRLRESPAAMTFFRDVERADAKRLLSENCPDQALSLLEVSFKLLNKVYTDASHVVLCTLCRVVACAGASRGTLALPVERWALLALRRYESVSDDDLLLLYGPLLHACVEIWDILGRDKSKLEEELAGLRKRGMKVDGTSLLEAVDKLENV